MSVQSVRFVLDRLYKDPALFHRFTSDPYRTLDDFDLTAEEVEAIVTGNRERLMAVGVDERVAGWIPRVAISGSGTSHMSEPDVPR